jgi:acyl-coenzyme A synthetase/AMP-(fatty) acid ligase
MNIVDPILFQAKINPEGIAICTPGAGMEAVTYGNLEHMMNNVGRTALSLGLARGDVVAIAIKDQILHAAIMLGLTRVGIVTVSPAAAVPAELGVQLLITDGATASADFGRVIVVDAGWTMGAGKPIAAEVTQGIAKDDICRILLTPAATGTVRGIALTHDNGWRRSARHAFVNGNRLAPCSRLYCDDVGLANGPAFSYLIHFLSKGATIYLPGDGPESVVQAFDLYKIQGLVATPAGLARYVELFESQSAFQCKFDVIFCWGGPLRRELAERVCARICANVFSIYGTPETGALAVGSVHVLADIPGSVGVLAPDAVAQAVDASGAPVAPGHKGALWFRTPQTVAEYVRNPPASGKAFRGGWFRSGEIGYLRDDRLLVVDR